MPFNICTYSCGANVERHFLIGARSYYLEREKVCKVLLNQSLLAINDVETRLLHTLHAAALKVVNANGCRGFVCADIVDTNSCVIFIGHNDVDKVLNRATIGFVARYTLHGVTLDGGDNDGVSSASYNQVAALLQNNLIVISIAANDVDGEHGLSVEC